MSRNERLRAVENTTDPESNDPWLLSKVESVLKKAKKHDSRFGISDKLGLSDTYDKELVAMYLAQRLVKIDIYDDGFFSNHPATQAARKFPLFNRLIEVFDKDIERNKEVSKHLNESSRQLIRRNYDDESFRPRTIELAVNDLVYQSIVMSRERQKFAPDKKKVEKWAYRWSHSLARQADE